MDETGTRRPYDAPGLPRDVQWKRLRDVLLRWPDVPPQDVDGQDAFLLMGPPDPDFFEGATAAAVREAEEVLRPVAACKTDGGGRQPWTPALERELVMRGAKLGDSVVLTDEGPPNEVRFSTGEGRPKLGARAFHLSFRYFVVVIVAGAFAASEHTTFSLEGKTFVGYYYACATVEQAQAGHFP